MKKITLMICCVLAWFTSSAQFDAMAIVGGSVGGWPGDPGYPDTDMNQMTSADGINWTLDNLTVGVGSLKFRANNGWDNNWGAADGQDTALSGTAVSNSGTNLSPAPGVYDVSFNSTTAAYVFTPQATGFTSVELVGTAAGSGISLSTTDGVSYFANSTTLAAGTVSFANADNPSQTWAPLTFPSGTAVAGDPGSLTVEAGVYNITFNLTTLSYSFGFPQIALVGSTSPAGWPTGATGEVDSQVMSSTNGVDYLIPSITLTDATDPGTTGVKFRQDNSWAMNWGNAAWPSGTATLNGANIMTQAGTYSVHFNRQTGAYSFEAPMSVSEFGTFSVMAYPNPARESWNLTASAPIDQVRVSDFSGKVVWEGRFASAEISLDASGMSSGMYFVSVSTSYGTQTLKLIKE